MDVDRWRRTTLGKIANLKRGYDLPKRLRRNGPFPIVSSSGVTGAHAEAKVDPPGVVTGRYGTLGAVYYVDEPYWPLNTTLYVQDFKGNHERFIAYLLKSLDLGALASSAAVPGINRNHLHPLPVRIPDRPLQASIAAALGAFDNLIENNRRRIEVLEEVARLLYREWFVHFRYPGHEEVELVDSDLGPIPEGWEVSRVCDALETVGGGTPSKAVEEYWSEGDVQWFTPTDITRARSVFAFDSGLRITELGLKKSSAKLFPAGSVMLTSRATIGAISISTTEATTNQGFITCVPSERLPSSYIYFWLHTNVDLFLSLAGGATFKEIRKSTFRELLILVPTRQEMDRFEEQVGAMIALIKNLLRQNQVLLEVRDFLLPRLVSGELDVSELDLGLVVV